MKRLLIDMDNCITDPLILEYINEFKNANYKLDEQTDFYLQNLVTRNKEQFWKFLNEKNLYENAELKDNCYEALKELNEIYDIYIVTSYLWKDGMIDASGNNLANKYNYLKEKLPFIKPEKYIFTTNKNIIEADIGIDDRLNNLTHLNKKILFDAWHNKNITDEELETIGAVRVYNWLDILKILKEGIL